METYTEINDIYTGIPEAKLLKKNAVYITLWTTIKPGPLWMSYIIS